MKTDAISQKILDDARVAAANVLSDAAARVKEIKSETRRRNDERRSELAALTERDMRAQRTRMLSMAELDQKKALLSMKRELIDRVFDMALSAMQAMPEPQKRAFNRRLLLDVAQGGEWVMFDEAESALFDDAFFADVNAALAQMGRRPVTALRTPSRIGGGFVLGAEGMEINCAYSSIVAQAAPSLEADVAQLLFER